MAFTNAQSLANFNKNLRFWINSSEEKGIAFQGRKLMRSVRLIIANTPRDTGRTRGEWQVSAYFPKRGLIGRIRPQYAVIEEAREVVRSLKLGARTYVVNNMPHIQVLEHGLFIPRNPGPSKDRRKHRFGRVWVINGFSVQAPRGIVKPVLEQINLSETVVKSSEY